MNSELPPADNESCKIHHSVSTSSLEEMLSRRVKRGSDSGSSSQSSESSRQSPPPQRRPATKACEDTSKTNGYTRRWIYHSTDYASDGPIPPERVGKDTPQPQNPLPSQARRPTGVPTSGNGGYEHVTPWYKRVTEKYGSLELENKGSVARDHLALERTFLAWLRTSLAFASIGIAVTQLFRLNLAITQNQLSVDSALPGVFLPQEDYGRSSVVPFASSGPRIRSLGKPLGATFIAIAILVLVIGFHRYFESQYWVVRGKFPASRGSVALIAFVSGSLMIASLVVILAISHGALES